MSAGRVIGVAVFAMTVAGAAGPAAAAAPGLLLVPPRLDLGIHAPDAIASGTVWLVNTGLVPVELLDTARSCGCIEKIEVTRELLAPLSAIEIPVLVHAPRFTGRLKPIDVTFIMSAGDPLALPILIETTGKTAAPKAIALTPAVLDFGTIAAGAPVEDVLMLSNTGRGPVEVIKVFGDDGSISFPAFDRMPLDAAESADLLVEVTPPLDETGRAMTKQIHVFVEGGPPVAASVRYTARHPLVANVLGYLDALRAGDRAAAASFLAGDAQLWIGAREGPGVALSADAPWGESAGLLRSGQMQDTVRMEDGAVTLLAWSIEGTPQGRPVPTGRLSLRLDGTGRITEIQCEPISIGGKERNPT